MGQLIRKQRVARAVHADAGLRALYRRRMLALVSEMNASIDHWIPSVYRNAPPIVASDANPVDEMLERLREVSKRWFHRFDDAAPKIADAYLKGSFKATDSAMRMALKAAGWAVKFEMTPAVEQIYKASFAENIGLIKSIPREYLQQVEGIVMRSYTRGRDLQTMVAELKTLYPKAENRAILIARDQSNKANSVVTAARQAEVGIVEAVWLHSHGGKTPRPDHVAADGKRYKVAEGCLISGEHIFPGELINCRCASRSILPF